MSKFEHRFKQIVIRTMRTCGLRLAAACLVMMPPLTLAAELPLAEVLRLALSQNPNVRVQTTQIDAARGQQQQAAGQFDWQITSGLNFDKTINSLPPSSPIGQTTRISSGYSVGLNRQLRNGLAIDGNLGANANQADSGSLRPQQNAIRLDVSLIAPLLKGRGGNSITVNEDVARLNVLRNRYGLRSSASQTLFSTLLAYWDYRTRVELRKVAQSAEERSRNLLASNQKLVDAAEKPRGDLVLLKADLADKSAAFQAASLAFTESRKNLGRLLGLDIQAINQLPELTDAFPDVSGDITKLPDQLAAIASAASVNRSEIKELALQLESTQRQLSAANNRREPQLDLNVGIAFGKASEGGSRFGFVTEPGRVPSSPSVFARLNYQFPIENNQAIGAVKEISASLSQIEIRQRDLVNMVTTGVDSAVQALLRSAEQIRVAKEGLVFSELAVNQEILKQKNGIATLIDVINVEARFVNARVSLLQFQAAYANALARLRFETGTFFPDATIAPDTSDTFSLDLIDLASIGSLSHLLNASH